MARYRKIDIRMWGDEKFRSLTPPKPCGQALWWYLLTCPESTNIPGIYRAGELALAEALGWSVEGFREAFLEVSGEELARADWKARVVWIPNAIRYHRPESPNVVRGWAVAWDEVPECDLKTEAWECMRRFLQEEMSSSYAEAFTEACPKPSRKASRKALPKPSRKPLANQEQEQEQEQEEENARTSAEANAGSQPTSGGVEAVPLVAGSLPPPWLRGQPIMVPGHIVQLVEQEGAMVGTGLQRNRLKAQEVLGAGPILPDEYEAIVREQRAKGNTLSVGLFLRCVVDLRRAATKSFGSVPAGRAAPPPPEPPEHQAVREIGITYGFGRPRPEETKALLAMATVEAIQAAAIEHTEAGGELRWRAMVERLRKTGVSPNVTDAPGRTKTAHHSPQTTSGVPGHTGANENAPQGNLARSSVRARDGPVAACA